MWRSRKNRRIAAMLLPAILLAFLFWKFSSVLNSRVVEFVSSEAESEVSLTLQKALYRKLSVSGTEYVKISSDSSGKVTSIVVDGTALSLLCADLTVCVTEIIKDFDSSLFGIPLGNLFSVPLLSGRGPVIPVKPVLSGSVAGNPSTTLQSVGINQSLHRVVITFDIALVYLAPFSSYQDSIRFDIVIAETLIVGEVPILYSGQPSF